MEVAEEIATEGAKSCVHGYSHVSECSLARDTKSHRRWNGLVSHVKQAKTTLEQSQVNLNKISN